jgi:hypothetical protein
MNQPVFNPVNELEEVLVRASKQPSARPEFYQKFLDSQIWLLTPDIPSSTGTRVLLGQPADYPHDLIAALQELFIKFQQVEAAYLAELHNPSSDDSPHLLIGIQCDMDMRQIASAAVTVAREIQNLNKVVDFVQVGKGRFDNYFQTQTAPFYQRAETKSRWKFW